MTDSNSTTIEISVCPCGKSTQASHQMEVNSDAKPKPCPDNSEPCTCKSLCIKITDLHGHLTNFIPLCKINGAFQKQLLQQRLSIVSQTSPMELYKPTEKSLISLLMANIPAFGILCALISVLCFSFNSVIVKLLKSNYGFPGIQVLVIRYYGLVSAYK